MFPRLILALLIVFALTACVAPSRSEGLTIEEQTVDGLTIGFAAPSDPKLNIAQEMVVTLTDAQGAAVADAQVSLDLMMPTMPMGTNAPLADAIGEGRYRAQNVVMDMTGDWEITVIANVAGKEHRAVFTRVVSE